MRPNDFRVQRCGRLAGSGRAFEVGAFHSELGGATEPVVPVGDLIGGSEGQCDLVWVQRGEQPAGDRVIDGGHGD